MRRFAEKLTKRDASGNTTQWGVQIPSSGFPLLAVPGADHAGRRDPDERGGQPHLYDKPGGDRGAAVLGDLSRKHKVHPPGIVEWGTTPKDFFERKVAMMWTTTGNLTNVKANAKFPFGVAMLPRTSGAAVRPAAAISTSPRRRARPSRQARSSSSSGSRRRSAPRSGASTPATWRCARRLRDRRDEEIRRRLPAAAVARDQLKFSVAELSTHENQRVTKALNDGMQAALTGTKTPSRR
jgi:sn-glycerol 3-phosphate transport system substrate-binding protein